MLLSGAGDLCDNQFFYPMEYFLVFSLSSLCCKDIMIKMILSIVDSTCQYQQIKLLPKRSQHSNLLRLVVLQMTFKIARKVEEKNKLNNYTTPSKTFQSFLWFQSLRTILAPLPESQSICPTV